MNIVQITPGAGAMYCGNCFRDNALVAALRKMGHSTLMVPLYLPLTLDEEDQSSGTPIFFSGINVYLEQKAAFFRKAPHWLHDLLASPALLKWTAGQAAKTRPADVGELTVSMLHGEEGNQARELDELVAWLGNQPRPDLICLSNAMLIGLARRLRQALRVPVVCMLQGEDYFLDSLPSPHRETAWQMLQDRSADVDLFIAPSRYFAEVMGKRLGFSASRVKVIYNGINLEDYAPASAAPNPPALGYFARLCREKGLDTLVDAFIAIRKKGRVNNLRLRVGGGLGPSDKPLVTELQQRLNAAGLDHDAEFHPNLDRAGKLNFLRSLSVFSTPASYSEAFGLYVIEALAAGVPVVQPRHAAFPELIEATGGGLLCEPRDPDSLAAAVEQIVLDGNYRRALGAAGRAAVFRDFSAERMAENVIGAFRELVDRAETTDRTVVAITERRGA